MKQLKILEIGSGKNFYKGKKTEDVVHLDAVKLQHVEIVHNLNNFPYPFEKDTFNVVIANHVLEHLDHFLETMNEIHRILRPGGTVKIKVPYFGSPNAFTDPTHKKFFTKESFDYWDKTTEYGFEYNHQVNKSFYLIEKKLIFAKGLKYSLVSWIENKKPAFYEVHISRIIPADEIYFELGKDK